VQSRNNCRPRTSTKKVRVRGTAVPRPCGSTKLKADFGTVMVARIDLSSHAFRDAARRFTPRHVRHEHRKYAEARDTTHRLLSVGTDVHPKRGSSIRSRRTHYMRSERGTVTYDVRDGENGDLAEIEVGAMLVLPGATKRIAEAGAKARISVQQRAMPGSAACRGSEARKHASYRKPIKSVLMRGRSGQDCWTPPEMEPSARACLPSRGRPRFHQR
jgi:hypothetical protein